MRGLATIVGVLMVLVMLHGRNDVEAAGDVNQPASVQAETPAATSQNNAAAVAWAVSQALQRAAASDELALAPKKKPAHKHKCSCGCQHGGECNCPECFDEDDYPAFVKRAVQEGRPLIVYVGKRGGPVDGCLRCSVPHFHEVKSGIVVGVPRGGDLYRVADLPIDASKQTILDAAFPERRRASGPIQNVQYVPVQFGGACVGGT